MRLLPIINIGGHGIVAEDFGNGLVILFDGMIMLTISIYSVNIVAINCHRLQNMLVCKIQHIANWLLQGVIVAHVATHQTSYYKSQEHNPQEHNKRMDTKTNQHVHSL